MDEPKSEIQSFYKSKTVFITGPTGFMGKVLIEKLLYNCFEFDKIYLLIRPKRGRSPEDRLDDMFNLPLFQRVQKEQPQVFEKVIVFNGDVTLPNLGLTESQQECLINEVQIVFHCAATLRLEGNLKDAIEMNTAGTKRTLDLVKKMRNLLVFVHLSTAFCHVDQEQLDERIHHSPNDPQDIMKLVEILDNSSIDLITPKLIEPHPNTYTYSKRLTETLVANEYPNIPCAIARPSIVCPSYQEPMPGWVDNLNGPVGILVGAGKGVIRSVHCNGHYHARFVPVDIAINALIAISYIVGTSQERPKSIPVYNIIESNSTPTTWSEILDIGRKIAYEYPFEGQIWYPDGNIRSNKFVHNLFVFFFHIIPAYFIDFLMLIFCQRRFMVRLQKRISVGLEVLQYFTTREWIFYNTNLLSLEDELSSTDRKLFPIQIMKLDKTQYIKGCILGARQYCMKENLTSLPRARWHQTIMYVIHITMTNLFYLGILYCIYNNLEVIRHCLDYITEQMTLLPILGGLIEKAHL